MRLATAEPLRCPWQPAAGQPGFRGLPGGALSAPGLGSEPPAERLRLRGRTRGGTHGVLTGYSRLAGVGSAQPGHQNSHNTHAALTPFDPLQARVYAEDPARNFLPCAGRIVHLRPPQTSGAGHTAEVRVDTGVREGDEVRPRRA